jgi:hypothetical protein
MAPAGGGYELFFDAQPGSYGFQILVDDQPVAQDAINLDAPSRVFVGVDESGAITGLDTVDDTTVAVTKQDEGGAPLPGACYALLDRGGTPAAQACDGDDGAADGTTTVRAPNGVDPGAHDLIETLTPDGQTPADAQALDLGPGGFAVEAVVASEDQGAAVDPTESAETPEEDGGEDQDQTAEQAAGQVVLRSVDENGDSLPGSCFVLIELGLELCDDDGDGAVVFEGVLAGSYTVVQSAAPAASRRTPTPRSRSGRTARGCACRTRRAAPPKSLATGLRRWSRSSPADDGTADDGTEEDGGSLALAVRDRDGNPVPGGCFALSPRDGGGGDGTNACDGDDGADDGEVLFAGVPGDRYRLDPTLVPAGFRAPDPQGIELGDGDAASLTVTLRSEAAVDGEATAEPTVEPTEEATAAAQPAGPGRLVILVADDDGQPVGNTCFAIAGEGANFSEICDQGNDGRLNIPDLPAGEYRVRQLQTERGLVVDDEERTVEVRSGEDTELPVVNQPEASAAEEPTESATEEPEDGPTEEPGDGPAPAPTADGTGELRIEATDQDGNPAPFGCYLLVGPAQAEPVEVCDGDADDADPDDGAVLRQSLPPGEYQIFETRVPPGAEPVVDPPLVAVEDGETATARFGAGAESDEGSRQEQEQEQEQPPVVENVVGAMLVTIAAEDGQPLGGRASPSSVRRRSARSATARTGTRSRTKAASGWPIWKSATTPSPSKRRTVSPTSRSSRRPSRRTRRFASGSSWRPSSPPRGACASVARDEADDAAAGACYAVTGPTTAEACDDEASDAADEPGVVLFEGLDPGDYAVAETRPATGFDAAPDASNADVRAGQTAEVEFSPTRQPETGGLSVVIAAAGQPVPGACLTLAGPTTIGPVCDVVSQGWMAAAAQEAPQDADPSPGRIELTEIPVGTYDLTLANLPAELAVPAPAEVEVRGGAVSDLAIDLEPAPGTLVILVEDEAGDPVGGTCVTLDGPVLLEDICDQGNDGRLNFPELPGGDYAITQTASDDAVEPAAPTTATVPPGGTAEVTLLNPRRQEATPEPTAATATATATAEPEETATTEPEQTATAEPEETATPDAETDEPDPVARARSGRDAGPGQSRTGRDTDRWRLLPAAGRRGNPGRGSLRRRSQRRRPRPRRGGVRRLPGRCLHRRAGVAAGRLQRGRAATGRGRGRQRDRRALRGRGGGTCDRYGRAPGEDEAGAVVAGQCFQIASDGNQFGPFCDNGGDDGDPAPGTLTIAGLPVGVYEAMPLFDDGGELPVAEDDGQLAATQQVVEQRSFTVRAGDQPLVVRLRIAARRQADGDLLVSKRDERNRPLPGSCFALLDGDGGTAAEACDDERGDGDGTSGQIRFDGVDAGDYTLSETRAPDGFVAAEDTDFQIVGGRLRRVTVRNEPLPEATASLAVRTVTEGGDPLPGACYALIAGGGQVGPVCDDADGDDGQTTFNDLEAGSYILRETREASPDYAAAADRALLIRSGEATTVDVVNAARPGSVLIAKTDEAGDPLAGACFSLLRGDGSEAYALCDGDASDGAPDDGALLLGGVAAATTWPVRLDRRPRTAPAPTKS